MPAAIDGSGPPCRRGVVSRTKKVRHSGKVNRTSVQYRQVVNATREVEDDGLVIENRRVENSGEVNGTTVRSHTVVNCTRATECSGGGHSIGAVIFSGDSKPTIMQTEKEEKLHGQDCFVGG